MTSSSALDEIHEAAANWVVRAHGGALSDEDLLDFDTWLSASPGHQQAYDEALDTWLGFDATSTDVRAAQPAPRRSMGAPARRRRRQPLQWGGLGALATAAAAALLILLGPIGLLSAKTTTYATGRGERRSVILADGSRLDLNAATRLTVRLERRARRLTLMDGEAAFTVVHDPNRPFVVATQGGLIRDVGTEFDVRQRGGSFSVTVSRGVIEVGPAEGRPGPTVTLGAGQRLERGAGHLAQIRSVSPEDDFSWRTGRLVLRNESLGEVVAELNLHFAHSIRVDDPELARRPVSGVLRLDSEESTLRRLMLFAPFKVTPRNGELLLQKTTAKPGKG